MITKILTKLAIHKNTYIEAIKLLEKKDANYSVLLVFSTIFNGFLQMFALIGVIPLINLIMKKEEFLETDFGQIFIYFNITNINHALIIIATGLILLLLIKNLYSWFHMGLVTKYISNCSIKLKNKTLNEVFVSKYEWIKSYNSQYLREVVFNYGNAWATQFIRPLLILINDFFVLIFILSALMYANPYVALVLIVSSVVLGTIIIFIIGRKVYYLEEKKRSASIKAAHLLTNCFQGIKQVKIAQAENFFKGKFNILSTKVSVSDAKRIQWGLLPRILIEVFGYCMILFIIIYLLFLNTNIANSASTLGIYAFAAFRIMPIISTVLGNVTLIINATPIIEQLLKIIKEINPVEHNNIKNIEMKNSLKLNNVFFRFNENKKDTLNDINLELKIGKTYGIVGHSGSGKTTLIDIISGIHSPTKGSVLVDDKLIKYKDSKFIRNFVGYVSQDPYIFDSSITENIAFENNLNIDKKNTLINSLKMSQLNNWIKNNEIRDINLGENGNKISGGQKQRLNISRLFYNDPNLIILDEGTSALDGLTENNIKNILNKLKEKKCIVIVAHRISTIQKCDHIFVIQDGKIIDQGTHRDLKKLNRFYKDVILTQIIDN